MLTQLYANNAITTLAAAILATDTSIPVSAITNFPNPGANQYFKATIDSGTGVEIIGVYGVVPGTGTTGTFVNVQRGLENTTAQSFALGTRIECRTTRDTLSQFTRKQDRLAVIDSVDSLSPPSLSDGNSYITTSTDDGGNPIVVIVKGTTLWRFTNYSNTVLTSTAQAGTTTTFLAYANANQSVPTPATGQFVIQFTSGACTGYARAITGSSSTGVTWATALPTTPAVGDSFEIYQSTTSIITSLEAASNNGLIYAIVLS